MSELRVIFPDDKSMKHFAVWFSECGEQDFDVYLECQDDDLGGFLGVAGETNLEEGYMVVK